MDSFEPWRVAYMRHTGRYQGMDSVFHTLFTKLTNWAASRGVMNANAQTLAVFHDDPG